MSTQVEVGDVSTPEMDILTPGQALLSASQVYGPFEIQIQSERAAKVAHESTQNIAHLSRQGSNHVEGIKS